MSLSDTTQLFLLFALCIFFSTAFLHLIKRRGTLVIAYSFQSLIIILLLGVIGTIEHAQSLLVAAVLTFVAKVIFVPFIFMRAIKEQDEKMLTGAYLNTPLTLVAIFAIVLLASAQIFTPIVRLVPYGTATANLALASVFVSLFLTINRKGMVHQIVGVLSMENSIVVLGALIGFENTFALELGMTFDVLMWTVGASVFIALAREHFGTLDTSIIKDLRD
ncbi:hypothetical protein HY621_02100 [Candidatus Uhrbacteria bacterium]|nr:hypothetical protein [Candidatus Uhrbacteria bacterium]